MAKIDPLIATAKELRSLLENGLVRSEELVDIYLSQISRYNARLKAVWSIRDVQNLKEEARKLDEERAEGRLRGSLHGIPYIVKDNTDTSPKYGLDTTAGSYALVGTRAAHNSALVDSFEKAGAILIGKATLSELNFWKGTGIPCAWSAIAGQGESAYVRGGFDPNDTFAGHSNAGGSSAGSAISVSVGFVPIATGSETDGSVVMPANRAALYAIKPTFGLLSNRGILPLHPLFDTPGLLAKSATDIGIMLDALLVESGSTKYEEAAMNSDLAHLRIGALDPEVWRQPPHMIKPVEGPATQMSDEINAAHLRANSVLMWASCYPSFSMEYGCREAMDNYLADLQISKVRTLAELVEFNKNNSDKALPGYSNQDLLEASLNPNLLNAEEYMKLLAHVREVGRSQGIDKALAEHNIDVIIGPADSPITKLPSAAGYPTVTMPLGYLDFNGRPFGLVAVASSHQEEKLMHVLGAWEATMPSRRSPKLLVLNENAGSL